MDTDAKLLDSGEGTKFPLFHALVDSAVTLLRATETDSVITYHAIAEAMGADVRNDNRAYRAFLRAAEIILRDDLRKVDNVRDVGYRIVKDTERRNVAKREELSSFRKLKKASATLTHVNMAPRFIPTRVGNTYRPKGRDVGVSVHPHARGEHQTRLPGS